MNTENFHIGAGAISIDGSDVGATTPNGAVVNYEPEVHLHKSGKYGNTPVKASLIGKTLTIDMELAESTLLNMSRVYAGVTAEGTPTPSKIKFGGISGVEVEGKIIVLTPYDGTASWVFRNAVPTSPVEMNYTVEDERVYKVTFTAMIDSSVPEDENLAYVS
ncbi:MAG: hypothetical protein WC973_03045 [Candidatus Dojkabacteria bacterium]